MSSPFYKRMPVKGIQPDMRSSHLRSTVFIFTLLALVSLSAVTVAQDGRNEAISNVNTVLRSNLSKQNIVDGWEGQSDSSSVKVNTATDLSGSDEPKRPNILFIFSDDHSPNAIGAYDGTLKSVDPTPNIDTLARQGMLFRNSFCTNSICGPSRAVILTGKHSHVNGFMSNGNLFDGDQQTFPKLLRNSGYTTAVIGKWHLKSNPQGFDYWDVLDDQGEYYNPTMLSEKGERMVDGYCTDIVTDLALDWLKENQASEKKPFMLMCQHKAPHRNWMPAPRHYHLYDDIEIPEPETLFDTLEDNASSVRLHEMGIDKHMDIYFDLFVDYEGYEAPHKCDESGRENFERMTDKQIAGWNAAYGPKNDAFKAANLEGKELVKWKYQRYIKNYLRCIKGVDESVGRLMDYLEETGQADNTIVIYSSDQGFYLGDHGWFDKRWMYEESLMMPLIVKWPGVTEPGSVDEHLVQNLDYAETLLEVTGSPIPDDMQGKSLVPILKGESPQWRDSIYYHYYAFPAVHMVARHYGVRTREYKLMRMYQFDQWEFYDLKNDPDEQTNQYNNPKYASQIAELKTELQRLQDEYHEDTPTEPLSEDDQNIYLEKVR